MIPSRVNQAVQSAAHSDLDPQTTNHEPGRADGFSEEERVEKVGQLSVLAVCLGIGGQSLNTEENDRQQSHQY